MNESLDSRKSAALKRLAEHLAGLDAEGGSALPMENDMLSLIVSGILNGENLAQRHPDFHQRLLENAELRQAFLDAIEAVEAERAGQLTPMPAPESRLDFLTRQPSAPRVINRSGSGWSLNWQRPLELLQAVFSPGELAYRMEQALIEDPWFTLLRDEITTLGNTYAVSLDCTVAADADQALSVYLSLAVTPAGPPGPAGFPLRASLEWGDYLQSVDILEEGRVRFANIPLAMIFDPAMEKLQSGLNLTLESASENP
jgi:hypothetical protein